MKPQGIREVIQTVEQLSVEDEVEFEDRNHKHYREVVVDSDVSRDKFSTVPYEEENFVGWGS